jgi:arylsulfatase A-like enzyme
MAGPREQPNVLLVICDQERSAPAYESEAVSRFRRERLPARRWLAENGVEFGWHHTGSTACSPSRPTLLTGQYPSLHAVTQTSGMAKVEGDRRLRWLRPADVPTLGDHFRAAGYDAVYKGKWHVSDADLRDPTTGRVIRTVDSAGARQAAGELAYVEANPLAPFGFDGWIGPEPHGAELANSGLRRDPVFAEQVSTWLRERAERCARGERDAGRPFLLVASFVNPHDICLWPAWAPNPPTALFDDTVPAVDPPPSADERLDTKPTVQRRYREAYPRTYGPAAMIEPMYANHLPAYRRFYYHLHQLVDLEIARVLDALRASPFFERTIVVFTSDHGELLGAHGGLHQKWFNMYDETVRVPFVVAHAGGFGPVGRRLDDVPTSHVDLLPTLLGLAGIDATESARRLEATHGEVHPLVGRDLSALVRGEPPAEAQDAIYFMTEDRVLEGDRQLAGLGVRAPALASILALHYDSIRDCATSIEGVVARLRDGDVPGVRGGRFKLVRTWDDPALWSEPAVRDAFRYQHGPRAGELHERSEAFPDEWELYDLDADPAELDNRAGRREDAALRAHLEGVLARERAQKRLARRHPRPYATIEPAAPPPGPWIDLEAWAPGVLGLLDRLVRV